MEEAPRGSRLPAESSPLTEAAAPPEVEAAGPDKVESKEKEAPETAPPHKPDSRIPATVPALSGGRTGGAPRGQQSSLGKVAMVCVIILVAVAGVYYGLRHFGGSRETSSPAPSSGTQEVQTLPSSSASRAGDSQAKAQVDALILDARSQLESNPGNAQTLLEEAVRLDRNHFDAAYQLGRLLTNKKNYQGALQHYQNALRINGQAPEVYFNMGYVYLTLGDYDSAIRSYESCWALKPAYQDEVLTNLGITYMKKNQQERAQALFRQALDANPNNLIARNYLTGASVPSSTQQASPQPPQPKPEEPAILTPTQPAVPAAVETTIASVAKGSVESLVSQAKTQFDTNPANAQKLLEEAIAQDKNHFDAVFQLGRLLTFRKDHQGAIQQYQKALAINSQAAEVYFNLGYVYMTLKDYDSAIINYEACRALAPPYQDEVFTNLGITYLKKNNVPQAQHLLKQALDLNPNNAIARSYLKNLEKAQGGKVGSAPGVAGADMLAAKPDQQTTAGPAQTARLEGKYSVEGTNPSGSTYQGTAVIGKSGERYVMTWNIANQSFSGNGAVSGNKLTINWTGSGGGGGVVVYTVMAGGILKGSWAEGSGSEILTPVQ